MSNQAQETKDAGVLAVIVARMEQQRLPRAIDLKAKVEQGGVLDDLDIEFLEQVFADSNELKPLLERHPEYQDLAARMMALYREITTKALENENK
jgi:hypothetical protein